MKLNLMLFLVVAAAAMAFGANSAFAANLTLNPATGELTYVTNDAVDVARDPTLKNDVEVIPMNWPGGLNVAIVDHAWAYPWHPMGINVFLDANAAKNCMFDSYGSGDRAFVCAATKVTVKTGKGDDEITVSKDFKLPTTLEGGAGIDWLQGGGGSDVIWGGCYIDATCNGHKDTLRGGDGNDTLHGGSAVDYLAGEAGIDMLDGGLGYDNLNGGPGNDFADYSNRSAPIVASLDGLANDGQSGENDLIAGDIEGIQGGSGGDTIYGNDSQNWLRGGGGSDAISGYGGLDQILGEAGSDLLRPGFGPDGVYGGSDADTVTYGERWNPVKVSLDEEINDGEAGEGDFISSDVENLTGGSADDTLTGNQLANVLTGGAGADTLDGRSSSNTAPDKLFGEGGNDQLAGGYAGSGGDTLDGGADLDLVSYLFRTVGVPISLDGLSGEDKVVNVENAKGGDGDDTLVGNGGPNGLFGGAGNDVIDGKGGNDSLYGMTGNDSMHGDTGNDVVAGGDGADILMGGLGADWIAGYEGLDTVTYWNAVVSITVTMDGVANDGAGGEGDNVAYSVENIVGGSAADKLTGSAAANVVLGGGGNDTLLGLGGNDKLDGQAGVDSVDGGIDVDTCLAEKKTGCEL